MSWYVRIGTEWVGPFLTQHQAGCVAMAFDGTVHSGHDAAALRAVSLPIETPTSKEQQ